VTVLVLIAAAGVFIGNRLFSSSDEGDTKTSVTQPTEPAAADPTGHKIDLRSDSVRVVDPPKGDRSEVRGVELAIDGDDSTGWETEHYTRANFGGLKPGMGILINLGKPTKVRDVKVVLNASGASAALLASSSDPGNSSDGDAIIAKFDKAGSPFTTVGQLQEDVSGTVVVFPADQETQFLVVWISKMPSDGNGKFQVAIKEITVTGE
jgi:hypothetical protein